MDGNKIFKIQLICLIQSQSSECYVRKIKTIQYYTVSEGWKITVLVNQNNETSDDDHFYSFKHMKLRNEFDLTVIVNCQNPNLNTTQHNGWG